MDWPVAARRRELAPAYPEAKLILTVRDDRWYEGVRRTIFRNIIDPPGIAAHPARQR